MLCPLVHTSYIAIDIINILIDLKVQSIPISYQKKNLILLEYFLLKHGNTL